jgi:predicted nucleic acid-binding protein
MRRYLLDTTPLVAYLMGRPAAVTQFDPWLAQSEVATSVLVYAEVVEGLRSRATFPALHHALRDLLDSVYPYTLTYPILDRYGIIRRQLRPPHGPGLIGDIDTLIAATALERNLTIVTCDADFQRVPGLHTIVIPRDSLKDRT